MERLLPWYFPEISMFVGIVWRKPDFQQFFNTFEEMGIIDIFIFCHPAIAISSVSLLVYVSVSRTQIIRFVIYFLYRFFTNHFDFICCSRRHRRVQSPISFNRTEMNFPFFPFFFSFFFSLFLSFGQIKFSMEQKEVSCSSNSIFFLVFFFFRSPLVGLYTYNM